LIGGALSNQRKPASWFKALGNRYRGLRETKRRDMIDFIQRKWSTADQPATRNSDLLRDIASYEQNYLLAVLKSAPGGISDVEAVARLREHGFNEVAHEQRTGWSRQLVHAFNNPFNILLIVLAVISYVTDDMKATIILSVMVGLSSLLRFVQEFRSSNAAERLKAMVLTTATVKRVDDHQIAATEYANNDSIVRHAKAQETREIPIKYLVPGDIVRLSAGDMIPADVRLLSAKDLFISQGALTGEAYPVEKTADSVMARIDNPLDIANLCFMGSNVVSGSATAVVVTTGLQTYFGGLSHKIVGPRANSVRQGHPPGELVADPFHAGDGAYCFPDQRIYQARLGRSLSVCDRGRRRAHAGNVADDRHRHAGQGRGDDVAPQGHRKAP